MGTERHSIQKQSLRVEACSEAIAMALQTRLPDLHRTVMLDTIEHVLDDYSTPARHVRLDRLRLDLGTIAFGPNLPGEIRARLERELRAALDAALLDVVSSPSPRRFARSVEEARLAALERYFVDGTVPFWTSAAEFDPEALIAEAADAAPDALVRLLRWHRDDPLVVHRLVRQLSDRGLQRILELLDPINAAQIAAAARMGEAEALDGGALTRSSFWVQALTDAIHERPIVIGRAAGLSRPERDTAAAASGDPGWYGVPEPRSEWSPYDVADSLRYYARFGVLPWTATLPTLAGGDRPLTVRTLADALPELPSTLLRAIFHIPADERAAAIHRVVELMEEDTRGRLLRVLGADRPGPATAAVPIAPVREGDPEGPPGSDVPVSSAEYVRVLLGRLDSGTEGAGDAGDSATVPEPGEFAPRRWDGQWIKSILAHRLRSGDPAGRGGPSSAALFQALLDEFPADASHFLQALQRAGVEPVALLSEPVSVRLFESSLTMLPARSRSIVRLLLQLVSRLPAQERPGDEDAVRTAAMGAVIDYVSRRAGTAGGEPRLLAAGMLDAILGPVLTDRIVRSLLDGVERLARDGEGTADDLIVLRAALDASTSGSSTAGHVTSRTSASETDLPADLEQLPTAVARRIAHVIGIVSAWPPGDRTATEEEIRAAVAQAVQRHRGGATTGAALMEEVLRAVLGSPVAAAGRLLADAEVLARRGELSPADVDALREAAASLADVAEGPGRAPGTSAERPAIRAETLMAELAARGRGQRSAAPDESSPSRLLRTLIARFPDEARRFLQQLRDEGIRSSTLLGGTPAADLVEPALELLRPLHRRLMTLLLRVVAALPAAQRPGSEEAVRSTIATVVLDHTGAAFSGEEIAAAALTAWFGRPLPAAVRRRMSTEASRLARTGQTGPAALALLLRVLGGLEESRADARAGESVGSEMAAPAADLPPVVEAVAPETIHEPGAGVTAPHSLPASSRQGSAARPAATPEDIAAVLATLRGRDAAEAQGDVEPSRVTPPRRGEITPVSRRTVDRPARLTGDAVRHILRELVVAEPEQVRDVLRDGLTDAGVRDRWVRVLAEPDLARIVSLLEPAIHREVIASAELLFSAWDRATPRVRAASVVRSALWSFVLTWLSRHAEGQRSVRALVRDFFFHVGVYQPGAGAAVDLDAGQRVHDEAVALADRMGRVHLRAVLTEHRAELLKLVAARGMSVPPDRPDARPPAGTTPPTRRPRRRMAFAMTDDEEEAGGDPIHIANAGLVIVAAFLPQLFARLDVLEDAPSGGRRVRVDAVSRTVHLLQYLADERTDAPEPLLCLNKVLCGVPPAVPVDRAIEMTARERELCDSLLAGVIEHWTIIKQTSVAGLRETFLQREGRLDRPPTGWRLRVQRRTVDVLLDHIPWTVSTIAHSWMPEPLYVTW